jgi:hypothetical protein
MPTKVRGGHWIPRTGETGVVSAIWVLGSSVKAISAITAEPTLKALKNLFIKPIGRISFDRKYQIENTKPLLPLNSWNPVVSALKPSGALVHLIGHFILCKGVCQIVHDILLII